MHRLAVSVTQASGLVLASVFMAMGAVHEASAQDVPGGHHYVVVTMTKQIDAPPWHRLTGLADQLTYLVAPGAETEVQAETVIDTSTCTSVTPGTWTITAPPKYGTTEFGTLMSEVDGYCPYVEFPWATVLYTWTSTQKAASRDTFKAEWTGDDYVDDDSFTVELGYIQINLVSPPAKNRYRITAAPKFPAIKATAQVVTLPPDPTATTQFTWTEKLTQKKGKGSPKSYSSQLKQSQTTTGSGEFDLQRKDNTVLVGGDLELDVSATVNGHILTGSTSGVTIAGTNPQRADVQSRIAATVPTLSLHGLQAADVTDVTERIACLESAQRQFSAAANGGVGPVIVASDNGVGLSQLTVRHPTPTNPSPFDDPNLVFDWRANTDKGVSVYTSKIAAARNYPKNLRGNSLYEDDITNIVNPWRVNHHLQPIAITPAPDFTMVGEIGAMPTDQLLDDATRGYNGYGVPHALYGSFLHEFKPDLDYLKQLPDSQLPGLGTDPKVWVRVKPADRDASGDRNYVSDIAGESAQCGG